MAWTASGIYASALAAESLTGVAAATHGWVNAGLNKFFMTTNADTPTYSGTLATSIYSSANECSGTGWAARRYRCFSAGCWPGNTRPNIRHYWHHCTQLHSKQRIGSYHHHF